MEPFLKLVAQDLYNKCGRDLSRTAVVFPNKRASLFFDEYLVPASGDPLWAPSYITISDLFRTLAPQIEVADSMKLICELYEAYRNVTHTQETLDDFYFWGEMLLADFDDVDKNMAPADRLFANLKELKEMNTTDFLTPEQQDSLKLFFSNFSIDNGTPLKERFAALWNVMGELYNTFRTHLEKQGLAYEGMLYRHVMEHFDGKLLSCDRYVFVGFNVLNKVEKMLFEQVRQEGKALFYFDYDLSYLPYPHEAGLFINENLKAFGNELPREYFDNAKTPKTIRYIASPTENAQARYLPAWLQENCGSEEKENAVVLCNEALLQAVIHSLSEGVEQVNVTMGFPLSQTPAYSFITVLLQLQMQGYRAKNNHYSFTQVSALLKHPYTQLLLQEEGEEPAKNGAESLLDELTAHNRFFPTVGELQKNELLTRLFAHCEGQAALCDYLLFFIQQAAIKLNEKGGGDRFLGQLYRESLFKSYTLISRLSTLIAGGDLAVQDEMLQRLIDRMLTSATIPFHGEPAVGLQIMGLLETRNLDFKNLIMLSVNEGQLPKTGGESSFIPYNLRRAFGLTTVEQNMAVYAYYFYRLLQRASHVTLVYNNSTEGVKKGEMSRFMLQYLLESQQSIERCAITSPQTTSPFTLGAQPKNETVMKRLHAVFDRMERKEAYLSPSALNNYLECQLRFYFKYVAGLVPKEEVTVEVDSALFGSLFHKVAEILYTRLKAPGTQSIAKEAIEEMLKERGTIERTVDAAFNSEFFKNEEGTPPEYNGQQYINRAVIIRYIRQLLEKDRLIAPFTLVATERDSKEVIEVPLKGGGTLTTSIGGRIDRLDRVNGDKDRPQLRIVDYKTGGKEEKAAQVEELFIPKEGRAKYIFQTFLYASVILNEERKKGTQSSCYVAPSLLYIHRAAQDTYSPVIKMGGIVVDDFSKYDETFRENLTALIQEIFDKEKPFEPTPFVRKCEYCDFKDLCNR